MVKRILILVIAVISLAGLVYWWLESEGETGEVKGHIVQRETVDLLTSEPIQPFISDQTGLWNIYTYQEYRDRSVAVVPNSSDQLLPVMIGDNTLLYFSREEEFFKLWKYTIDSNEKDFVLALRDIPKQLTAAPNGHYAVYSVSDTKSMDGSLRSFLVHLDSHEVRPISDGVLSIQISPDSRRMVYNTRSGTYYSEILRTGVTTDPLLIVSGVTYAPIFSIAGEKVYYIVEEENNFRIKANDLRGQNESVIIEMPKIADVGDWTLDLSADSQIILYTQVIDQDALLGNIGHVRVDGSQWEQLINNGISARWSRTENGDILYNTLDLSSGNRKVQIWKMNSKGNYREALTRSGNNWLALPKNSSIQ